MAQNASAARADAVAELTIGDLARPVIPVDGRVLCHEVDRIFAADRSLTSLIIRRSTGDYALLDRSEFEYQMSGTFGYGRMLYADQAVQNVLNPAATLALPATTAVRRAHAALMRRDHAFRFKDLLALNIGPEGIGTLSAAVLLDQVAQLNAHEALHDSLTGLANRGLLSEWLERALSEARIGDPQVALMFIDIDRFKVINDSMGHAVGDQLLRLFANRLSDCAGPVNAVARFGGDEFAVLLSSAEGRRDPALLAGRVLDELQTPFTVGGHRVFVSGSVGIAIAEPGDGATDLLRKADIAMYQAKRAGGSQCSFFNGELGRAASERRDVEVWLRESLEIGAFEVHYQPIVNLTDGALVGFESLVRGRHPDRGLLLPGDFLPVAEETGLVTRIDLLVLETTCRQAAVWAETYPAARGLRFSVNVSSQQLDRSDFVDVIEDVLNRTGVDPGAIRLELTEGSVVHDVSHATRALSRVKNLGVTVAIDDFGTGYSSLAQLSRFPADALKIDRTFVAGMVRGAQDEAIVKLVLALGRAMEVEVVAEGIEKPEQAALLHRMGCEQGQGYLFGRAIPARDAEEIIRDVQRDGMPPWSRSLARAG